MSEKNSRTSRENPLPPALISDNPLRWMTVFGPGAVIASLTIGAGELIFSSRAGALFGYRLLWFFLVILVFKWALVFASARHMVLTGAHPFQRWLELPGPRGWFPLVFLLLALVCFPIWVAFHAGTIGTLVARLAGTDDLWRGGTHFIWGMGVLAGVLVLVFAGGYTTLERVQLIIVLLMLGCVTISLVLVNPDWFEFLKGFVVPQPLDYPDWVPEEFAARPIWVETITYVGVIGGSGYDYLAYVSYLRDKHWGRAGSTPITGSSGEKAGAEPASIDPRWLRAPMIDCTLSFLAVLVFSAVFVACGAVILGPQHQIPGGADLLSLQAEFVTPVYPWLKHVYFAGAFLTILGTLYGTIEVAPTVLREIVFAFDPEYGSKRAAWLRLLAAGWAGAGGLAVLIGSFGYSYLGRGGNPPGLIEILTPANLFTGVLACGWICLLNLWMDRRFLPRSLRMGKTLTALNLAAAITFVALGLKGYWDHRGWKTIFVLLGTLALGWIGALGKNLWNGRRQNLGKH